MPTVKRVFFPLDQQLGLTDKHYSDSIIQAAVWLSGVAESFEQAEETLKRIGKLSMSDSTIWRRVERRGAAFNARQEQHRQAATALPHCHQVVRGQPRQTKRMGVGLDGGMIHLRQEGWNELKSGCIFEVEVRPTWDKKNQEWVELPHAVHNSYVAHLGGPERLGELVWAEAESRGWNQSRDSQVIGDGAVWIWNLANQHFYDSTQVVDWYHATDHLASAAHLLYPHDPVRAKRWFEQKQTRLFQGHAEQIVKRLIQAAETQPRQAEALLTAAGYFDKNKGRMHYLELREEGYLIGSGMVESGIKQFKARFCGPGMRWSRAGAERLIPIRAAILSGCFDTIWDQVCNSPPT